MAHPRSRLQSLQTLQSLHTSFWRAPWALHDTLVNYSLWMALLFGGISLRRLGTLRLLLAVNDPNGLKVEPSMSPNGLRVSQLPSRQCNIVTAVNAVENASNSVDTVRGGDFRPFRILIMARILLPLFCC